MTVYQPETHTIYILATGLKLRSKRTLTHRAFDSLLDLILSLPHCFDIFFWKRTSSFFIRFTTWTNTDLEKILNLLIVIQTLNPVKGQVECFTDKNIIYSTNK